MRLHPADFFQRRFPFGQRGIIQELLERVIRDRQDFRTEIRRGLADFRKQILQLPHAREVFWIRAVLGELKRREMKEPLDSHIERLFEFKARGERYGRFAKTALPLRDLWIRLLDPSQVLNPFVCAAEEVSEIPFVGVGKVGARESLRRGHWWKGERPTLLRFTPAGKLSNCNREHQRSARVCIAGCRAIMRMALRSNPIPGGMRCHCEAPEGCGNGIRSKAQRFRRIWKTRPTTSSSFSNAINCAIA